VRVTLIRTISFLIAMLITASACAGNDTSSPDNNVVQPTNSTSQTASALPTEPSGPAVVAEPAHTAIPVVPEPTLSVPTATNVPPNSSLTPTEIPSSDRKPESDVNDDLDDDSESRDEYDSDHPLDPGQLPDSQFPFPEYPPFGTPPPENPDGNEDDVAEYTPYVLPTELEAELSGSEWQVTVDLDPEFIGGHVGMDYISTAYLEQYRDATIEAMNDTGSDWVFYDQYATYYSVTPPEIDLIDSPWDTGFRSLSEAEIIDFVDEVHESGSKFGLILELNYDGLLTDGANPFSDTSMSQAESGELYIAEQADLQNNNDPDSIVFWDSWFDQYTEFVISHAHLAESTGIEMLVVGKQLGAPTRESNTQRWRDLIAQVRAVYSGSISYAQWVDETQGSYFSFPFDAVDYAMIYQWGQLSDEITPSVLELEQSLREISESVYKPLSLVTGNPIIFLTPFQSRSGAPQQVWYEPTVAQPEISVDLVTQAAMYQALFRAVADQDWVAGVVSWGFWWRDDFENIFGQGDASFDKSSTIRNKPAVEIWRRWLSH